eukprot:1488395-Prymnesium_polylepis.2
MHSTQALLLLLLDQVLCPPRSGRPQPSNANLRAGVCATQQPLQRPHPPSLPHPLPLSLRPAVPPPAEMSWKSGKGCGRGGIRCERGGRNYWKGLRRLCWEVAEEAADPHLLWTS